jgi:hypothetical protein
MPDKVKDPVPPVAPVSPVDPTPSNPTPVPLDPFSPNLIDWKFSHNNCPELIVQADSERSAIKAGLKRIGLLSTPHPCRVWPVKEQQ